MTELRKASAGVPGRFAGRKVIVTGPAHGTAAVAARRLAREGAQVAGVDLLAEPEARMIDEINTEGLNATFVGGDISKDAVCARMVRVCVDSCGSPDAAINNAGVMDALHPDEAIDDPRPCDRLVARPDSRAANTGTG